jgi:hypothetical protein
MTDDRMRKFSHFPGCERSDVACLQDSLVFSIDLNSVTASDTTWTPNINAEIISSSWYMEESASANSAVAVGYQSPNEPGKRTETRGKKKVQKKSKFQQSQDVTHKDLEPGLLAKALVMALYVEVQGAASS